MDSIKTVNSGKYQQRNPRIFSKEFKKDIAEKIENRKLTIKDVKQLYNVSDTSVRKWLYENSNIIKQRSRMVVEKESEGYKIQEMLDRIAELERTVGKKQLEIEFLNKVIDICSDELGYDVKKKEYHDAIEWYRKNKVRHRRKLQNVLEVAGISRQSHHNYMKRKELSDEDEIYVINSILEVRSLHPQMGIKKIYFLLQPDMIGRDNFIRIGVEHGLSLPKLKNYQRTTYSSKFRYYRNLTAGLVIKDINRIWVSDITYINIKGKFYYITFIEDVYSRMILGYEASETLHAEWSCNALHKALLSREGNILRGLIHHSDRGSQYTSREYIKILKDNEIQISLCDTVYENTHIERVNGIIKNEYLLQYSMRGLKDLKKELKEAVNLYNKERPHWNLGCKTPVGYEETLKETRMSERKVVEMWSEDESKERRNKIYEEELF